MDPRIDRRDFDGLVRHLGDRVRVKQALRHLVAGGAAALPAVRSGLTHPSGDVRMYCARALDQLVDANAWPTLIAMLDDPDPRVRVHTLHAIACDRCKQDVCEPAKGEVLPRALAILRDDPFHHVRAMAIEVVGRWAHEDAGAAAALEAARDADPKPMVRKKAGWYAPGGVIFEKQGTAR